MTNPTLFDRFYLVGSQRRIGDFDYAGRRATRCEEALRVLLNGKSEGERIPQRVKRRESIVRTRKTDKRDMQNRFRAVDASLDLVGVADDILQLPIRARNGDRLGVQDFYH